MFMGQLFPGVKGLVNTDRTNGPKLHSEHSFRQNHFSVLRFSQLSFNYFNINFP